jgi:hypothetical protein
MSDAYVTHSPAALALSPVFFAGADDAFYDYSSVTDSYVERAQADEGEVALGRPPE